MRITPGTNLPYHAYEPLSTTVNYRCAKLLGMALLTLDPETRRRDARRMGAGIRRLRERIGLTQTDLASRLHMSTDNLRLYERGEQALTVLHLRPWAEALEVSRAELCREMGLLDDDVPDAWWGRAELEAEGMDLHEIDRHEATLIDQPIENQRAIIDLAIKALRQQRRREGGAGTNGDLSA